jgi:predicted ABC-type ATPase
MQKLPSTKVKNQAQLRLRVFAGPNGSGKSTVIEYVRDYKSDGRRIDFGYYINADDIAELLRTRGFSFGAFHLKTSNKEFRTVALESGLINAGFDEGRFSNCYLFRKNAIKLKDPSSDENLAQIIADFLRKKLLSRRKRFSFETVFSHESKLEIMQEAANSGYKVYLYFVSTDSPEINKFRVQARIEKGGHGVPPDKIESRYYRSLGLLYRACQLSYQVFFFDNSLDGADFKMFAHFKKTGKKKQWDKINTEDIPNWFKTYYSKRISS